MKPLTLILTALFAATSTAQFTPAGFESNSHSCELCNLTFADANGTGIFSFDPGVVQGSQDGQPGNDNYDSLAAEWAITLFDTMYSDNPTLEMTGWYNTNGANYSDNAQLWYDVCVLTMNTVTLNTQYRAVKDVGDCEATFDTDCNDALKAQSEQVAYELVANPTPEPGSNLTQGSLARVCYDVGVSLTENFPKECNKYFNGSAQVLGSAITSHNDSWLYNDCSLTKTDTNDTFHYVTGISLFTDDWSMEKQESVYAAFAHAVIPVLTVFLPVADVERVNSISTASSSLTCAHVNRINEGSLQPVEAPEPTAVGSGGSLDGGKIAGVTIGAIAFLAIIAGCVWFFYRRWKRATRQANEARDSEQQPPPPAYTADPKFGTQEVQELEQPPIRELDSYEGKWQAVSPMEKVQPMVELPEVARAPTELPADSR